MVASETTATTGTSYYGLAGWLSIASAVLLVPEVLLGVLLGFLSPRLEALVVPLHIVNVIIGVFILYMLRKLLNERFDFHNVDIPIIILIWANVIFFFIGLVDLFIGLAGAGRNLEIAVSVITVVLFVPFCVVHIVLGTMLLKMKDDLFGLLKPYAVLLIISGALGATVILAPLGLLAAVGHMILLGMIFLRAKEETEFI